MTDENETSSDIFNQLTEAYCLFRCSEIILQQYTGVSYVRSIDQLFTSMYPIHSTTSSKALTDAYLIHPNTPYYRDLRQLLDIQSWVGYIMHIEDLLLDRQTQISQSASTGLDTIQVGAGGGKCISTTAADCVQAASKASTTTPTDRRRLVLLASRARNWKHSFTLLKWHWQGIKLFWRQKLQGQAHKPRISEEISARIKQMTVSHPRLQAHANAINGTSTSAESMVRAVVSAQQCVIVGEVI